MAPRRVFPDVWWQTGMSTSFDHGAFCSWGSCAKTVLPFVVDEPILEIDYAEQPAVGRRALARLKTDAPSAGGQGQALPVKCEWPSRSKNIRSPGGTAAITGGAGPLGVNTLRPSPWPGRLRCWSTLPVTRQPERARRRLPGTTSRHWFGMRHYAPVGRPVAATAGAGREPDGCIVVNNAANNPKAEGAIG